MGLFAILREGRDYRAAVRAARARLAEEAKITAEVERIKVQIIEEINDEHAQGRDGHLSTQNLLAWMSLKFTPEDLMRYLRLNGISAEYHNGVMWSGIMFPALSRNSLMALVDRNDPVAKEVIRKIEERRNLINSPARAAARKSRNLEARQSFLLRAIHTTPTAKVIKMTEHDGKAVLVISISGDDVHDVVGEKNGGRF